MQYQTVVEQDIPQFLEYLKGRYKVFHLSNIFFRDMHYGIWGYLEHHGMRLRYHEAEEAAREVIGLLEKKGILKPLDSRTWVLMYTKFKRAPARLTLTINTKQAA